MLIVISSGVALFSVFLSVLFFWQRKRVSPWMHQIEDGFMDMLDRVTGRRSSALARAYLVPVIGLESDRNMPFEIFGTTAIGRSRRHADLLFHIDEEDSPISRLHCTILDEDDHFALRDEDSLNGTILNGRLLEALESVILQEGDIIEVGPVERGGIRFRFQEHKTSEFGQGQIEQLQD
jgi:hypothetical protein